MLDLSSNRQLELDETAVATILQCIQLRLLSVYKSDYGPSEDTDNAHDAWDRAEQQMQKQGYTASQFSLQSWKILMQLPCAFYKRHGRELVVGLEWRNVRCW